MKRVILLGVFGLVGCHKDRSPMESGAALEKYGKVVTPKVDTAEKIGKLTPKKIELIKIDQSTFHVDGPPLKMGYWPTTYLGEPRLGNYTVVHAAALADITKPPDDKTGYNFEGEFQTDYIDFINECASLVRTKKPAKQFQSRGGDYLAACAALTYIIVLDETKKVEVSVDHDAHTYAGGGWAGNARIYNIDTGAYLGAFGFAALPSGSTTDLGASIRSAWNKSLDEALKKYAK